MRALPLERLRLDELAGTWVSDACTPFHIGLLGVFDDAPFRRVDGSLDAQEIARQVAVRASHVPGLRRGVLWTRRGEGRPVWVEDPTFNASRHVVRVQVVDPANLLTWAATRSVLPLATDAPLWRVDVIDGLPSGRFALLVVVHHVLADGLGGLRLLAALLDEPPDVEVGLAPARRVLPLPSRRELVMDRLAAARSSRHRAQLHHDGAPRGPTTRPRRARLDVIRSARRDFGGPVPVTSLPRRVGPGRRLVAVAAPLDDVLDAAHRRGVTVNDLVLAAITEGLHDLLRARGDLDPAMVLRTTVPVASGTGQASGMLVVPLPAGEPDAEERLEQIHRATAERKARLAHGVGASSGALSLPVPIARPLVRWGRRWGSRRVHLAVSNVRGPATPLWLAGARMLEAVPIAPLVPLVPISCAALSLAGSLVVSVTAEALIQDLDVMARGMRRSLNRV